MCQALMKYETIGTVQLDELMARKEVTPPEGWTDAHEPKESEKTPDKADVPESEDSSVPDAEDSAKEEDKEDKEGDESDAPKSSGSPWDPPKG